jgi:hypothetical protein
MEWRFEKTFNFLNVQLAKMKLSPSKAGPWAIFPPMINDH